jgi:hypothetical protein
MQLEFQLLERKVESRTHPPGWTGRDARPSTSTTHQNEYFNEN